MAAPLLTTASTVLCAHGGRVTIVGTNPRVRAGGQPVALATDGYLVAGCPFLRPPPVPNPCVRGDWVVPAARVRVLGRPVVLQASSGLGLDATSAPQGPLVVVAAQPRVRGI